MRLWQQATGAGVKVRNIETEEELAAWCEEMRIQREKDLQEHETERRFNMQQGLGGRE